MSKKQLRSRQDDRRSTKRRDRRAARVPAQGWRGRGGGAAGAVEPAPEWRGTTRQVCGLWPFAVGAGTPMVGVPFGRHLETGATLCCDPINWYKRAKLILNPSMFMLGKPGLGKTSAVMRMAVGLAAEGTIPLVLGDTRPDYVAMIEALDGQVISLGRSEGAINVLDPGEAPKAAAKLRAAGKPRAAARVLADAQEVRLNMVMSLVAIVRKQEPSDRETTILSRGIEWMDENFEGTPVLGDLLDVIRSAPRTLRDAALDRGDEEKYRNETENLEASLMALLPGGRFGDVFARPTTAPMRRDRAVAFDVSSIPSSDGDMRAAALLACWSMGFATVNVAQVLADEGLEPRRHYFVILDELHQALKGGPGLVDRVDYLTRLNRTTAVGQVMITHTMKDLLSLPREEDRQKATGFIERSGYVVCGGLPMAEMPLLTSVVPLSNREQQRLSGWTDPPSFSVEEGEDQVPPGRGKFLVKVGGRAGIPVDLTLTSAEISLHMSASRWRETSRTGPVREEVAA